MNKIYAGIGSRETPPEILTAMTQLAANLSHKDWMLRSGHADGADRAFEEGSCHSEIHLPWASYNKHYDRIPGAVYAVPEFTEEVYRIAAQFHPVWNSLSQGVHKLMARNTTIVLGHTLEQPVDMVVCWTPDAKLKGGTAHAMKIADRARIPVFNLANPVHWDRLEAFVQS
jgi:hypothetical protein